MSQCVLAHDDIDIGIADVLFNNNCVAEILLVNNDREVPSYFYRKSIPASLTIKKGGVVENLGSLSLLDKERKLQRNNGRLWVHSKNTYKHMPEPISVTLEFFGEFFDHGGDNNTVTKEIDCILGVGQIKGKKILPKYPDIKLSNAYVDPATCLLNIKAHNLTDIPLADESWNKQNGAFLMQLNLSNNIRLQNVPLLNMDPMKQFTHKSQVLQWQSSSQLKGIRALRVGFWRVKGDLDFENNQLDLSVPKECW